MVFDTKQRKSCFFPLTYFYRTSTRLLQHFVKQPPNQHHNLTIVSCPIMKLMIENFFFLQKDDFYA